MRTRADRAPRRFPASAPYRDRGGSSARRGSANPGFRAGSAPAGPAYAGRPKGRHGRSSPLHRSRTVERRAHFPLGRVAGRERLANAARRVCGQRSAASCASTRAAAPARARSFPRRVRRARPAGEPASICRRRRSDQTDAIAVADHAGKVAEDLVRTVVPGESGETEYFHDGGLGRSARASSVPVSPLAVFAHPRRPGRAPPAQPRARIHVGHRRPIRR